MVYYWLVFAFGAEGTGAVDDVAVVAIVVADDVDTDDDDCIKYIELVRTTMEIIEINIKSRYEYTAY